jgi:hypothetical protein
MNMQRVHPLTAVTAICLVAAVAVNFFSLDRHGRDAIYLGASAALASPFAVLLIGHLTLARTWRRNAFLAMGNFVFAIGWAVASFLMRWFQPGWAGVAFFGFALSLLAGLYVLLTLVVPERLDAQAV